MTRPPPRDDTTEIPTTFERVLDDPSAPQSEESQIIERLRRHAQDGVTVPEMIPMREVLQRIHDVEVRLRKEIKIDGDRTAIEAARTSAEKARDDAKEVAQGITATRDLLAKEVKELNTRRGVLLNRLIVADAITIFLLLVLGALMWAQHIYATNNRDHLDQVDRTFDSRAVRLDRIETKLFGSPAPDAPAPEIE